VLYTALDALELGFETYYIEDATRALSEEGFRQAKELVAGGGGKLVTSDRVG
jgi:nicotinamidase/pyrazinamidase